MDKECDQLAIYQFTIGAKYNSLSQNLQAGRAVAARKAMVFVLTGEERLTKHPKAEILIIRHSGEKNANCVYWFKGIRDILFRVNP